jgi:hypothetical protein
MMTVEVLSNDEAHFDLPLRFPLKTFYNQTQSTIQKIKSNSKHSTQNQTQYITL